MSAASTKPLAVSRDVDHPVYAVAGGNHVRVLLDRDDTDCLLDVIEVLAQSGGGPPPHRHAFAEWFHVLEGKLTLSEERGGTVRCTRTLTAGDSMFVAPWTVHGTLNLSDALTRFQVVGQPGAMTGYFRQAGVRVPDELTLPDHQPAGPAQLRDIAARWGIEFWSGPVENPPSLEPE